jgi:hypothetical protein
LSGDVAQTVIAFGVFGTLRDDEFRIFLRFRDAEKYAISLSLDPLDAIEEIESDEEDQIPRRWLKWMGTEHPL